MVLIDPKYGIPDERAEPLTSAMMQDPLVVCPSNNWQWVGMISGVSKPVPALSVTDAQREVLESLARSQSGPHREVVRAKALLMAADGASNATIAARLSVSRSTVANWRTRFTEDGLVKFGQVREGRGASPRSPTPRSRRS